MRPTTIAVVTTVFLGAPLALVLGACATSTVRSTDEADAGAGADTTSGDDAGAYDAGGGGALDGSLFGDTFSPSSQCERDLDVGALTISNSACFVNQHVENQQTKLFFPCNGGTASAVFGGHTLSGTVSGNLVSLKDVEPFTYDSCQWQSTETIQGDLSSGTLRYDYTEKPLASCTDQPCIAGGDLAVSAGSVTVVK